MKRSHAYSINLDTEIEEIDIQYCGGDLAVTFNSDRDRFSETQLNLDEIRLLINFFEYVHKCETERINVNRNIS